MKREKIEYRLKRTLDAERYRHTLGVAKTARWMAERFGVNPEKAELAGLLHDCAKCMSLGEMKKAARSLSLDETTLASRALLHAPAGMCVAKERYGVEDPEVLGAIRWHTTGRAGMTKLEKIVYLADMIEPNRKPFPGMDALRRLCGTDLDEALRLALRLSLAHVLRQGNALHPDTMDALAEADPEAAREAEAALHPATQADDVV